MRFLSNPVTFDLGPQRTDARMKTTRLVNSIPGDFLALIYITFLESINF